MNNSYPLLLSHIYSYHHKPFTTILLHSFAISYTHENIFLPFVRTILQSKTRRCQRMAVTIQNEIHKRRKYINEPWSIYFSSGFWFVLLQQNHWESTSGFSVSQFGHFHLSGRVLLKYSGVVSENSQLELKFKFNILNIVFLEYIEKKNCWRATENYGISRGMSLSNSILLSSQQSKSNLITLMIWWFDF